MPTANSYGDHGLRPRDLHFDLVEHADGCRLRGRGVLIVEADAGDWPILPVAAAVE